MTARVVCFLSSENMKEEPSGTVDLVVTSPPYLSHGADVGPTLLEAEPGDAGCAC